MSNNIKKYVVIYTDGIKEFEPTSHIRLEFNSYFDAFRKFIYMVWRSINENAKDVICSMYCESSIMYNYTNTDHVRELVDCVNKKNTTRNLTVNDLSKLAFTALLQEECEKRT